MSVEKSYMVVGDKYRRYMYGEGEKDTRWRHGAPPNYDLVNKLFEEGRTKEWPKGSLEEVVQNAVKTWDMELEHKTRLQDFKTINPDKFSLSVNGTKALSGEETLRVGSYNALLKNSLPEEFKYYKVEEESFESSHEVMRTALPRGFAWEVLGVYSGPPVIAFKFRHWGIMEGPYKGHAPTGEKVEFTGMALMKLLKTYQKVDDSLRAEDVEIYYDPADLFGGLLKGPVISDSETHNSPRSSSTQACPFLKDH